MQIFYDSQPLHTLGKVLLSGESCAGDPEEAPQRWRWTRRVKINFHQGSYADNQTLVRQVRNILRAQEAVLKIVDDAGNVLLNQTASLTGHDLPEDPNERGAYFQSVHLTFTYYEALDKAKTSPLEATYQNAGVGTPVIHLGQVATCREEKEVARYSALRPHRESGVTRYSLRGKFAGDPSLSASDRRTALLTALEQMRTEVNGGKEGRLIYGNIDRTVRISGFIADVDQARHHIEWSLTAQAVDFPNEASYTQAQFEVATREDRLSGKLTLAISGEIASHSEAAAKAKLDALRAAFSSGYSLTESQTRSQQIDGADGAAFLRLSFDDQFEKTPAGVTQWTLRLSDQEDARAGLIRRTYSGTVTATSAASFDAAYQAAHAKAVALGDFKHQLKLGGSIQAEDNQQSAERQTAGDYRAKVEFSFEYQLKGSRAFMEITSELNRETFGPDSEQVSGFIVAADATAARNLYAAFKAGYGAQLRNERHTEHREKIGKDASPVGATRTPPNAGAAWGGLVNAGETTDNVAEAAATGPSNPTLLGINYARQWVRLDFSFNVFRPKASGTVALSYTFEVARDFVANEKHTRISDGTIWADSQASAEAFLDTFIAALGLSHELNRTFAASRERYPGQATDTFAGFRFSTAFVEALSNADAVLETTLEEDIELSGPRIVVQPTAASTDRFQTCGTQSGRRTVSGECVATTETAALDWVKKQKLLPIPTTATAAGETKKLPDRISFSPVALPLRPVVGRAGAYGGGSTIPVNFKAIRCRFQFTELFTELTMTL